MRYLRAVSKPDLVGAGIVIAVGVFVAAWSPRYKLYSGAVIGPGFVPFWFGLAIAIFGMTTVIGAFIKVRGVAKSAEPEASEAEAPNAGGAPWHRAAVVFGLTLVAAALTPLLGFAVAFGIVTFVVLRFVERERWWVSLIVTAGVMTVLYLLFARFLQIPIPIGPWGF